MSFNQFYTNSEIVDRLSKLEFMLESKLESKSEINKASTREPMPHKGNIDILPLVILDLQERDKVGRKKYGTTLQSNNGRNALVDAAQEAMDLVMYLRQELCDQEKRIRDNQILLDAVKNAYRKHHLGQAEIGWDELSEILMNALCNVMGEDKFCKWLNDEEGFVNKP